MAKSDARRIGRYLICGELAAGGMATVHIGRLLGPVGFARTVAIKRLHAQFAKDPEFVSMFLDEARLAARIRHPNVVPVIDVVASDGELFLVMDFVIGESLSRLLRVPSVARDGIPVRIALSILCGCLQGLHAAHETKGDKGDALGIVHRDISPQNMLVGSDGAARLIDFGIAKAMGRVHASQSGQLKGKLPYMAPEHVRGEATRQSDVFSSGVVLWELITGKRLFAGETEVATFTNVLQQEIKAPSAVRPKSMTESLDAAQTKKLDEVILRSLERDASKRFATAREFALALERIVPPASTLETSEWMEHAAGEILRTRSKKIAEVEELTTGARSISMATVTDELSRSNVLGDGSRATLAERTERTDGTPSESIGPFGRTETSHVTPSDGFAPKQPERRYTKPIVVGVAAVGVLGVIAVLVSVLRPNRVIAGGESVDASAQAQTSADAPHVPAAEGPVGVAVAPFERADAGPPGVEASSSIKPKPVRGVVSPQVKHSAPATAATTPPKPLANDCDPPYTLGADGKKHFKAQCFGK